MFCPAVSANCPDDCTHMNTDTNTCYWVTSDEYRWADGQAHCEANGGYLALVKTAAVKQFFADNADLIRFELNVNVS